MSQITTTVQERPRAQVIVAPPLTSREMAKERIGVPSVVVQPLNLRQVEVVATEELNLEALVDPGRGFTWVKNVFLGGSLSFAEAAETTLRPVAFVWRHLHIIGKAAIYLSLPLMLALACINYVPGFVENYHPRTWSGGAFLLGLYIASAMTLLATAFTTSFLWKGTKRLLNSFARKGAYVFGKGS